MTMNTISTSHNEVFNLLNLIRPWAMVDQYKVRIGADADGGYVMPSNSIKSNLVLSIGIGDEVSFDKELAERGAKVLQFDHTISSAPYEHPNIFFSLKVGGRTI